MATQCRGTKTKRINRHNGNNAAPKAAPKTQTTSAPAKTGLDIDALLG